jgi:hypothetical protein
MKLPKIIEYIILAWVTMSMFFLILITILFIAPLLPIYYVYRLIRYKRQWRPKDLLSWNPTKHYGE